MLNRLFDRFRPDDPIESSDEDTRQAQQRSEQIIERVMRQAPEVQRHSTFARRTMHENELAPKIRRALRESF